MLRKRLIALTAILVVAVTCMDHPNLVVERLKEYVVAVALGQEEDKKTTEITAQGGGGKWYTPGPDGKLVEVPNRLEGLKPEDLGPAVEEAAPDPTNKWPVMEMTTVEPDQPATNGLELKVADPVLPEGAEKIDISAVTLGPNDWEKRRTNVEKSPLLSMEYTNEKIEKRLYLQFSGMGDDMTSYKVYRGKEGDKPIKSKATNKLPDEYEQIGTLKMPIGTKGTKETKEEKLTSTLNLFYYILKMREEKGLKGNIVCVCVGEMKKIHMHTYCSRRCLGHTYSYPFSWTKGKKLKYGAVKL